MKFLKTKNISKWSVNDRTMIVYPDGNGPGNRVVFNAKGGMMLPKGTTAQRPQPENPLASGDPVRQPTDTNGTIRYNTTTSSIEAFVGDEWEVVRAPGASTILRSRIGTGNDTETVFGPLNESFLASYSRSDNNIIVLVENVFQIGEGENFDVEQSSAGNLAGPSAPYSDGWYVKFTSAVPLGKHVTVYYGYSN
jgi:hypothetical protein